MRNPCILLIFDLNQPFKRVLGLHELENVYVRDVGRYIYIFIIINISFAYLLSI